MGLPSALLGLPSTSNLDTRQGQGICLMQVTQPTIVRKATFTRQSYVQSYLLRIAFSRYELRFSKRQCVNTQRST
jgi:hypothetical protein